MSRSSIINVMEEAVRYAGNTLLHDYNELVYLRRGQGRASFFKRCQEATAKKVINSLNRSKLELPFYGLNDSTLPSQEGWLIKIFDGDVNLQRGNEFFSLGVALFQEQEIKAAAIYSPICNRFYWAQKDLGAYFENRRLRCDQKWSGQDGLIAVHQDRRVLIWAVNEIIKIGANLRILGALDLTLAAVALGNYDALICTDEEKNTAPIGSFIAEQANVQTAPLGSHRLLCSGSHEIVKLITKLIR